MASDDLRGDGPARIMFLATVTALGLALVLAAWLGSYSRMIADDFCTTVEVAKRDVLGATIHWYANWSGRYSFHVATSAAGAAGRLGVRIVPLVVIVAIVISSYFCVRRLTRLSGLASASLATAIAWALVGHAADPFQTIFWMSGSLTYTLPLAFVLVWAGMALAEREKPGSWQHALLFIAAGFSETLTALLGVIIVAAAFLIETRRPAFIRGAVATAIGAGTVIAAPGNATRAAQFERPEFLDAMPLALGDAAAFARYELVHGAVMLVFVCGIAIIAGSMCPERGIADKRRWAIFLIVSSVWAAFAPFVMARQIMGLAAPLRSLQPTHAVLVVVAAATGWLIGTTTSRFRVGAVAVTAILAIPVAWNIALLAQTAGGVAVFAREWDRMDDQLRASRGKAAVVVAAPRTVGRLHFVSQSPQFWTNQCMADYYGIGQIMGASIDDEAAQSPR